jgi:hypothetical protein
MRICLTILLSFITIISSAQLNIKSTYIYQGFELKANKVYLFCRGTGSKLQLISNSFNLLDTNITHVGIGYVVENVPLIFNVTNTSGSQNAFKIDNLESFIGTDETTYFSIWEFKCGNRDFKKIKEALLSFIEKRINFDYSFLLNNGDSLYCSEFCALIINFPKNIISPTKKILKNNLYEIILNRKSISYYPVDFFTVNNRFRRMFECRF